MQNMIPKTEIQKGGQTLELRNWPNNQPNTPIIANAKISSTRTISVPAPALIPNQVKRKIITRDGINHATKATNSLIDPEINAVF